MARLKIAVLISGRGSNLQALLEACAAQDHPAAVTLVVSNQPAAAGLDIARRHGVEARLLDHRGFASRGAFDEALDALLRQGDIGLVCMAGFMRILGGAFVERWRDRLVNIHPSLLPAFKGRRPQQQALDAGVRLTGCTVHFVRPEMDAGPIIAQAAVPVLAGDNAETLSRRILAAEHRLYPAVVRLIAEGRVRVAEDRVILDAGCGNCGPLFSLPA